MSEYVIEQAIFGYDDGHRLLQTSLRLSSEEKERLLLLSDLAPGISHLRADGYWTGAPLRGSSRYALIRTWPAPEMSRPGCVWSHVLFVPFEFLEIEMKPFGLLQLFRRPGGEHDYSAYSESVSISKLAGSDNFLAPRLQFQEARRLAECLYFLKCPQRGTIGQDELGLYAIAVWSQQWSALRKVFSFRTVERTNSRRSPLVSFDMMLHEGVLRLQTDNPAAMVHRDRLQDNEKVLHSLAVDLTQYEAMSSFRSFLTSFAVDFPLHSSWTAYLASVQQRIADIQSDETTFDYSAQLMEIGRALPSLSEGAHLKAALIDFSPGAPLSFPPSLFVEALMFFATSAMAAAFPPIKLSPEVVTWSWAHNRQRLLEATDNILSSKVHGALVAGLLLTLTEIVDEDDLMRIASTRPQLQRELILVKPELLGWSGLLNLTYQAVSELLDAVTDEQIRLLNVIPLLIRTSDTAVAQLLCDRYPEEVLYAICTEERGGSKSHRANNTVLWFAGEVAPKYLNKSFIERLKTTSALFAFAVMLGFVNERTTNAGTAIWIESAKKAIKTSAHQEFQIFEAFLLSLSIARPQPGCEFFFEYAFQDLHEAMRESRLDYQASVVLGKQLPEVSWWRTWDSCHRLRVAVIRAYIKGELSADSFLNLSNDHKLMESLFRDLESDEDAVTFLKKVQRKLRG